MASNTYYVMATIFTIQKIADQLRDYLVNDRNNDYFQNGCYIVRVQMHIYNESLKT